MVITLIPPNSLCSFLEPLFAHFPYSNHHWVLKILGTHTLLSIFNLIDWLPSCLTWITPVVWDDWLHPYILVLNYLSSTLHWSDLWKHKSDHFTTFPLCHTTSVAFCCLEGKYQILSLSIRPCMDLAPAHLFSQDLPAIKFIQVTPWLLFL